MIPEPWFEKKKKTGCEGFRKQNLGHSVGVSQMGSVGAPACLAQLLSSLARQN